MSRLVAIFKSMFQKASVEKMYQHEEKAEMLLLAYTQMMDDEIHQDEFFKRLAEVVESEDGNTIIALVKKLDESRHQCFLNDAINFGGL